MIETDRLTKRRAGRAVVSDATFRCEPGTVTGFLGPNGAGKTTTLRMLVGLSEPDGGEARILGGRYREISKSATGEEIEELEDTTAPTTVTLPPGTYDFVVENKTARRRGNQTADLSFSFGAAAECHRVA
jgi:ABC-type hemin transport system ATPase subunit